MPSGESRIVTDRRGPDLLKDTLAGDVRIEVKGEATPGER
jgi:hypothetical protein